MTEENGSKSGGGCLKWLGIGCLVVVGLVVVLVVVGVVAGEGIARNFGSKMMLRGASESMKGFGFPESEREAVMAPIREFAKDVREGRASGRQVGKVVEEVFEESSLAVLAAAAFRAKHLASSELSEEEKLAGAVELGRFAHAAREGLVSDEGLEGILDLISEEQAVSEGGKRGKRRLKPSLTDEEVRSCIAFAKQAADDAEVEQKEFEIDLAGMVREAIERGMSK